MAIFATRPAGTGPPKGKQGAAVQAVKKKGGRPKGKRGNPYPRQWRVYNSRTHTLTPLTPQQNHSTTLMYPGKKSLVSKTNVDGKRGVMYKKAAAGVIKRRKSDMRAARKAELRGYYVNK